MTWTLLRKELSQHWLALLLLLAGAMVGDLLLVGISLAKGGADSPFEGLRIFLWTISTLGALVLNHRLVVLEYQARTQLFLEGLPLARWRMVGVKYLLGLVVLLVLASGAITVAGLLSARHNALAIRQVAILVTRSLSIVWLVHSLCFLMGLLGRYRLALYVALAIGLGMLQEHKMVDLLHWGPTVLLDERFPYEREDFPWNALGLTWGLSLALTGLAFGLSLTREGSVAALLSEKMQHREKVFIAALLAGLLCAASILSEKTKKTPFDLLNAATEQRPGVVVKVISSGKNDFKARQLAKYIADELTAARDYLGASAFPPVFVNSRRDLDANRYERGELKDSEGVLVRANFRAADWRDADLLAWLLREVLITSSNERARLESRRWVLDGFGLFWTGRDHFEAPLVRDEPLALRALYGTDKRFSEQDLREWLSFKESVGDDIAGGVAWSGLKTLSQRQGPEKCRKFLQAMLGDSEPKDVRATLHTRSWQTILREQTGQSAQDFLAQWVQELGTARQVLGRKLENLPRLDGQVTFVRSSADSRTVRFRLKITPPPGPTARYAFLYFPVGAYDEEVPPNSIRQEQHLYADSQDGELPGSYARGGRIYWTLSLPVPELGCPVISGWRREEIR